VIVFSFRIFKEESMKGQGLKTSAVLSILLFLHSCSTSTVYIAPEEKGKIPQATSIIVRTGDGVEFELHSARLEKGKIIGFTKNDTQKEIDFSSIQAVIIKKSNNFYGYLYGTAGAVLAWLVIGADTAPSPPPVESCPFVYSFDGKQYIFEAEPYGGAICRELTRSEWIGLDHLSETNGFYRIQIANALEETEYTDELKLLVVDHARGFKPVPDGSGKIHVVSHPLPPSRACDKSGHDISPALSTVDGKFWENEAEAVDPADDENLRDELTLEFPKPAGAQKAILVANAWTTVWGSQVAKRFLELYGRSVHDWTHEVDSLGPEYFWVMNWYANEELYLLKILVETGDGWKPRGVIYGGGPFIAKDKAYELDTRDVPGDMLKIRLRPPAGFWRIDSLAIDYSDEPLMTITELAPFKATDQAGQDVRGLLAAADGRFLTMPNAGDYADVFFCAPPAAAGTERTFILKTTGYYDIHLAAEGEPQTETIKRIHREPGFALRFAFQEYLNQKKDSGKKEESAAIQRFSDKHR
jgi:hypothetical protein